MSDLRKELEKRGTAEVSSEGIVNQITQALSESETKVKLLLFGELQTKTIVPIEQACADCDHWQKHWGNIHDCQISQKEDAQLRGFTKLICPEQFGD